MYDFKARTFNGVLVSYSVIPYHAIVAANKHDKLTPASKAVYLLLLAYAAKENTTTFRITPTWVSDNLCITRKTASAALALLSEHGFVDSKGIIIPEPNPDSHRKTATPKKSVEKPETEKEIQPEKTEDTSIELQIADEIRALEGIFGVGRVPESQLSRIHAKRGQVKNTPAEVKITPDSAKNSTKTGNLYPSHITNPTGPSTEPLENIPPNADVGVFYDSASRRIVKSVEDRSCSISKLAANTLHKTKLRSVESYIQSAMRRMRVGTKQAEQYFDEIVYSITKGAFSTSENQMKSVRACLKIIENGQWRAPAGMY
jgi:hypothetical protein